MSNRNAMRWPAEWYAARQAERARECAIADGRADEGPSSMDCSIATIERVVAAELGRVPEAVTLPAILLALRLHPKVAWAERMNTGGARHGEQYVRYGWAGMSDITGQMHGGRRLEVEAKASDGKPTPEQLAYLALVRSHGGVAFWARSVDDVMRELAVA